MIKQQFISVNAVMRLVTTMIVIMVLLVYAITGMFIYIIEKNESQDIYTRIHLALNVETNHALDTITEYSFWDDSYENLVQKRNSEWISDNIANYLLTKYDFDFSAVQRSDRSIDIIAQQHHERIKPLEIRQFSLPTSEQVGMKGASMYVRINNTVYQIITMPFVSEETEKIHPESLILGKEINKSYLEELIVSYELPVLSLSDELDDSSNRIVLQDYQGKLQGLLNWKHESATRAVLPYMILAGVLLLLGAIYITRRILFAELGVRVHYEQRLYQAATRDDLTGISNRKFFIDYAEREFNVLRLESQHYCLLMLDIDYFKKINDTYGHAAGDEALIHLANLCKSTLREQDLFGRIGGEEFAIFLPDTDEDSAYKVAERIHFQLKENPLTESNLKNVQLSVSIGLASNSLNVISFDELLKHADEALYQAKNDGRNRTVIATSASNT